jgi:hypothetical protein
MWYLLGSLAILIVLYFYSYYGWVRQWHGLHQGKGVFSLHYDRLPNQTIARFLAAIHAPLRALDNSRYGQLYDTGEPVVIPDNLEFPDFEIQHKGKPPTTTRSTAH